MSVTLPSDELLEIKQFTLSLMQIQPVTICQVMSYFWARPFFVPVDMHNFANCVMLFRANMLNVYNSPDHLSFAVLCQLWRLLELQQSSVPL